MKDLLAKGFTKVYKEKPTNFFSTGGRFEVLGNHTDHNNGLCIAGTCSLAIYGATKKRNDNLINIYSEGFEETHIDLNSLQIREEEKSTNAGLVRGIAYYLTKLGYKIGGFDLYLLSLIPSGAGISSSAAFELLVGYIFNALFNNKNIDNLSLAQIGQSAERYYYGKMCGLLDQIGVSYGGLTYMDFKDNPPYIEKLTMNLKGYSFLIVNSGGSHASLSHLYAEIPKDMYEVAKICEHKVLRDCSITEVQSNKDKFNNCQFNRAMHYFNENLRVEKGKIAIEKNDIELLINLMNETRESCTKLLKNMCMDDQYEGSPLQACDIIFKSSNGKAGVKINGGGFAGSVIALIPESVIDNVINACINKYGKENVLKVGLRDEGPIEL